jgi:LmbE family N-acetylglucosaminyl deacetylase
MQSETAPARRGTDVLPAWRHVLAVVAHPDDESFGLGAVLDRFVSQGAEVHVLCLTEGEASTVGAGINLGQLRRDELAAASGHLGVSETAVRHHPDGALRTVSRHILAGEVVDAVGGTRTDGLLTFDTTGVTSHPDHVAATAATLQAADVLELPVLAWTIPAAVADQLNEELGPTGARRFAGRAPEEVDLVVTVDRDRQAAAIRAHSSQAVRASPLWRRLELLGDTESLRWLRPAR